jgi:alkaline phosphatase
LISALRTAYVLLISVLYTIADPPDSIKSDRSGAGRVAGQRRHGWRADSMLDAAALRDLIRRRLTRRTLFRAGGAGVATALIVGADRVATPTTVEAASLAGAAAENDRAVPTRSRAEMLALDPHAFTGRVFAAPAEQAGPCLKILPLTRAKLLAGGRFDLRVEATGVDPSAIELLLHAQGPNGPAAILTGEPIRTSVKPDSLEVTYKGLAYETPGTYSVAATIQGSGVQASVEHEVVVASAGKKAKNVIFFLGDGMGQGPITAARILSRGIVEGKYNSLLEIDRMQFRGLVTTSGSDSISTDSANSMSAYMTGHKSAVNAMGVYEGNDPDPNRHPWQETMAELLKRTKGMAIGIVTTAEIQDATPAAVFAHTRRRSEYLEIMDQALDPVRMPDVLMGGGLASLVPQSVDGSRRKDDRDLTQEFRDRGFAFVQDRTELKQAAGDPATTRLLGLYAMGHMQAYIDRELRKDPMAPTSGSLAVTRPFGDQPTLMEMTAAAIAVLEKNPNGFFLMVEGANIDKFEPPLDWQRAVYEAIELDQAVGVAKRWAASRDDTLIVVTADHNHSMSVVGIHDRGKGTGRDANGVYAEAGFPNFVDSNGNGFPDDPDPTRTLFVGWSNHPDHRDDFGMDLTFTEPALVASGAPANSPAAPNPAKDVEGELQTGNLPLAQPNCVHAVDDVAIVASGPGSERVNGVLDNTEVFFVITDAVGVDARRG